ncbi:MAG: class I SAM-dependent methyltransferase [Planctomycetaceae bacterium]|nr:class I SAM-dependent methyltransferase [Planctomycetaceae bacterium]
MTHPSPATPHRQDHTPNTGTHFLHKEYPKQFERDQFWQQIKRTVNGQPVSDADIRMILDQVTDCLQLNRNDHLLDIGCGNAALSSRLFSAVRSCTGVDFSSYLLEIARQFFPESQSVRYLEADMRDTDRYFPDAADATKVLLYGCGSYITSGELFALLQQIHSGLPHVRRIMIGNLPDRSKAAEFFQGRGLCNQDLDDSGSAIGVWWDPTQMATDVRAIGFDFECRRMPMSFYGAKYRFDVLLQRHTARQ